MAGAGTPWPAEIRSWRVRGTEKGCCSWGTGGSRSWKESLPPLPPVGCRMERRVICSRPGLGWASSSWVPPWAGCSCWRWARQAADGSTRARTPPPLPPLAGCSWNSWEETGRGLEGGCRRSLGPPPWRGPGGCRKILRFRKMRALSDCRMNLLPRKKPEPWDCRRCPLPPPPSQGLRSQRRDILRKALLPRPWEHRRSFRSLPGLLHRRTRSWGPHRLQGPGWSSRDCSCPPPPWPVGSSWELEGKNKRATEESRTETGLATGLSS